MIEFDKSEYLDSSVEDGELIAVLSFYDFLPIMEAIALKDMMLYHGGSSGSPSPNVGVGPDLEFRSGYRPGDPQNSRFAAQTQG